MRRNSFISHRQNLAVIAAMIAVCAGTATSVAAQGAARVEAWQIILPPQSSLVFARDGSLIGEIGREWRTNVSIQTLPAYLPNAFVAIEDQRFYKHDGVDLVGVAAAVKDAVLGDARGASTITQQLVGNMHPDIIDRTDVSLSRKIREQRAAREMEKHYNKQQILEAYLNQISFGRNWFGIDAAARHYFGKPASQVTIAEAATLAAMPKGPALYDPIKYPARVKQRRDLVLTVMAQQNYITAAQAAAAKRTPLVVAPNAGMSANAPYFVDAVRGNLERHGISFANGGLRVHTTLDPALQRAADDALVSGLKDVEARRDFRHPTLANHPAGSTDYLQGAVVAMAPETGDVLALSGGRNYAQAPFNRAINGMRQPGSAFKPFVYATAVRDSVPPNAIVADTALTIAYDRTVYEPRNADGEFLGPMTLRTALARSRNPVAVQLWMSEGASDIIALARRAGLRDSIAPYPSSAIGASVVQPLNLVSAYTVFANLGTAVEPRLVTRVESADGRTLWSSGVVQRTEVLDSATAFIVRDMMRDGVERGTATSVRQYVPEAIPVAGKTGTTDEVTDVWFVGMTPDVVAGVWLGFDRPRTILRGAAGGSLAAPIFGKAIAQWYRDRSPSEWAAPGGLIVVELDRDTGDIADATTPPERVYTEYFLPGTDPVSRRLQLIRVLCRGVF
ncbi:MAG TPA: PBP1A family penicillin-binding protein [Gemmatimonadaceae bacterium]|nr:PBP1A family penicillin-binding protein [Gemmatimonadaceae bacterium]